MINIITPCSRPDNLIELFDSINFPCTWYIVFDANDAEFSKILWNNKLFLFDWIKPFAIKGGKWGNRQRNFALDLIKDGYVYFLDDDTTMHPDFYPTISSLQNDFIQFDQCYPNGEKRLGGKIRLKQVDSGNVLIHTSLIGTLRWETEPRYADYLFINEAYNKAKNPVYIPKVLSIYNSLKNG